MTKERKHLTAAIGLGAMAALLFGLLGWALVAGAVVEAPRTGAENRTGQSRNVVHTRRDNPRRYWLAIGLLGFWGSIFALVSAAEYADYRAERRFPTRL